MQTISGEDIDTTLLTRENLPRQRLNFLDDRIGAQLARVLRDPAIAVDTGHRHVKTRPALLTREEDDVEPLVCGEGPRVEARGFTAIRGAADERPCRVPVVL